MSAIDISDRSPSVRYFIVDGRDKSEPPACLKLTFSCYSPGKLRERLKAIKIGQTIKVLGEVYAPKDEAEIHITNSKLLK